MAKNKQTSAAGPSGRTTTSTLDNASRTVHKHTLQPTRSQSKALMNQIKRSNPQERTIDEIRARRKRDCALGYRLLAANRWGRCRRWAYQRTGPRANRSFLDAAIWRFLSRSHDRRLGAGCTGRQSCRWHRVRECSRLLYSLSNIADPSGCRQRCACAYGLGHPFFR